MKIVRKSDLKVMEMVTWEGQEAIIIDMLDPMTNNIVIEIQDEDDINELSVYEVGFYEVKKVR